MKYIYLCAFLLTPLFCMSDLDVESCDVIEGVKKIDLAEIDENIFYLTSIQNELRWFKLVLSDRLEDDQKLNEYIELFKKYFDGVDLDTAIYYCYFKNLEIKQGQKKIEVECYIHIVEGKITKVMPLSWQSGKGRTGQAMQ